MARAHLPTSAGFLLTLLFTSLSKEQGPPMHRQNTYVQRNGNAGRRMSGLAPGQRARQLSLLAPGGLLDPLTLAQSQEQPVWEEALVCGQFLPGHDALSSLLSFGL